MDDYEDPVDVLTKLPADYQTNLESKKWTERRDALQAFLDLLIKHPKLDPKAKNYGEHVETLRRILEKDANINVQALSAKCLNGVAAGLKLKFAPHAIGCVPTVFEKFKEKKPLLRDPLAECIDSIYASINLEQMQDETLAAMEKPNPNIKIQTDLFLYRAFKKLNATNMPKKTLKVIVPLLIKHTGDSDPDVREASYSALGSAMRAVGEKPIQPLLADIVDDKMKMGKIKDVYQKVLDEVGPDGLGATPAVTGPKRPTSGEGEPAEEAATPTMAAPAAPVKEIDPFDMLDPVDVVAKLPEEYATNLESKKWTERRDALQAFLDLLIKFPKLEPKANYGEHVETLRRILEKDANINVQALSAKCLNGVAAGLRLKFAPHAIGCVPTVFEKFKEKKPLLRDPLAECIDSIYASINLEQMQDETLAAMEKPNPNIKIQTDLFLYRAFKKLNATTMPKKTLKAIVPLLIKHTGDSDPEVRDASYLALGSAMRAIGEKPILPLLADIIEDKTKMSKIKECYSKVLEEVGPEAVIQMVQSVHKADPPAAATKPPSGPKKNGAKPALSRSGSVQSLNGDTENENLKPSSGSAPVKKPVKKAAPPPTEEEEPAAETPTNVEILAVNEGKQQRIKDEKQMRLIKWNFATPTDEHIQQLTGQLGAVAKVGLTQLLFNKDFKLHIKAIEMLRELGETQPQGVVKNSDLLLKWCTLRFFETNPAVLIKVLELCMQIVRLLRDFEEPLSIEEINSFVPYLLLKSGEQKDVMRQSVHEIVNEITDMCGPLKLTPFIIDALKTKNSRQRTECLTILDDYVTRGGATALKATGIHKAIGACVSDRDTGVRNAAINALVSCYREEGDQMWKNVGKLADKDRSYVEERIKRTGAAPGSAKPPLPSTPRVGGAKVVVPANAGGTVVRRNRSRSRLPEVESEDEGQEQNGLNSTTTIARENGGGGMRPTTSRYAIDDDFVELTGIYALPSSKLVAESDNYTPRIPSVPSRPTPTTPLKRSGSSSSISSVDTFDQLEKVIHNISSGIPEVAQEALEQITVLMNNQEQRAMVEDRISMTMQAVATQLNLVRKIHGVHSAKGQILLKSTLYFFHQITQFPQQINMDDESMCEWLYATIPLLPALDRDEEEQTKKSFNVTIIRISQRVERTVFFVACCRSLMTQLKEDSASPAVELFVKCLYKWQDVITKSPQPLRLVPFLTAINDFFNSATQDPVYEQHNKTIELCLQLGIITMGDAVQNAVRRLPNPHSKLISYCNVFLQQMLAENPNWEPKLPGIVAKDLPQPKTIRPEPMRKEIHILVDNVVRDLNSLEGHVAKLVAHLDKTSSDLAEYDSYTQKCCLGSTVRKFVEEFRKGKRLRNVNDQLYVDLAQKAMTMRARLDRLLGPEVEPGSSRVLQKRDINTDSFDSELPIPSNLVVRPPPEEQKTMRKVRRSIDPLVYKDIKSKLAGISDA